MMAVLGHAIHALEDREAVIAGGEQDARDAQRDRPAGVRTEQADIQVVPPAAEGFAGIGGRPRTLGGVDVGVDVITGFRVIGRDGTRAAVAAGDLKAPIQVGAVVAERGGGGTGGAGPSLRGSGSCATTRSGTVGPAVGDIAPKCPRTPGIRIRSPGRRIRGAGIIDDRTTQTCGQVVHGRDRR